MLEDTTELVHTIRMTEEEVPDDDNHPVNKATKRCKDRMKSKNIKMAQRWDKHLEGLHQEVQGKVEVEKQKSQLTSSRILELHRSGTEEN
jgi:hypothetical protein